MTNPWLAIPLADYEGHMASPAVGQAEMLADEFEALLKSHAPTAVALVGCAGGNGFDKAARAGVTRLVGICKPWTWSMRRWCSSTSMSLRH